MELPELKNKKIENVYEILELLRINSRFSLLLSIDSEIKNILEK
jgi:hypothetical protein